jgi:hypothetical protein
MSEHRPSSHEYATAVKTAGASDDPCTCKSVPECPECGGLECLCRPRFFAGQLLTEEDLNRLEHYIVEKNKLHNRYLHGTGVVCGLEVVCHPCPDRVTVRTGYALSPCGEDIAVCQDTVVNVCELIQKCRPTAHTQECGPFHNTGDEDCQDLVEDWILAICYDEKPSRGITALRGSSGAACCSRCNCGGSSACGCSCHSQGNVGKKNSTGCHSTQRNPPPQCEPTVICEGYSFVAYKASPANPINDRDDQSKGEWTRRYNKCRSTLTAILSSIKQEANNQEKYAWFQEFKAALLDFFAEYPTYDCSYLEKLNQITLEPPVQSRQNNWGQAFSFSALRITALAAEYWVHCFCSTLLPPCPPPVECNCVPLATVKVRRPGCHILEVCNWGPRRLVLTFPNLQYWLSPLGSQETLSAAIVKLCCAPFPERRIKIPESRVADLTHNIPRRVALNEIPKNPFATFLSQTWLNKDRTIDAQTLMLAVLGFTGADNQPLANKFEFDNALPFLLMNQVVRPTLEGILPTEWTELMKVLADRKAKSCTEPVVNKDENELAVLREMVEKLNSKVEIHEAEIAKLQKNK